MQDFDPSIAAAPHAEMNYIKVVNTQLCEVWESVEPIIPILMRFHIPDRPI